MNSLTAEKGISEIVGVFTDPIIVYPGGWGDTLPDRLKENITLERLVEGMKMTRGGEMTGTDAEACAYLYTASLTFPFTYEWTQIYLYVATQTMRKWNKSEVPADVAVEKLDNEQMRDLQRLKAWIYRTRTRIRLERDRTERRQQKQEAEEKSKAEQPALFTF